MCLLFTNTIRFIDLCVCWLQAPYSRSLCLSVIASTAYRHHLYRSLYSSVCLSCRYRQNHVSLCVSVVFLFMNVGDATLSLSSSQIQRTERWIKTFYPSMCYFFSLNLFLTHSIWLWQLQICVARSPSHRAFLNGAWNINKTIEYSTFT